MLDRTALKLGNLSALEDEANIFVLIQRGKHVRLALERADGTLNFFNLDAVTMPDGQRLTDSVWLNDLLKLPNEPAYFVPSPPSAATPTDVTDITDCSAPPVNLTDEITDRPRTDYIAPTPQSQPHKERLQTHARLAKQGLSQREIAKQTGWSVPTVAKDLREVHERARRTRTRGFYKSYLDISDATKRMVVSLYDQGATGDKIEQETSVTYWFQSIVLWEYGRKAKPKQLRNGKAPKYLQDYIDAKVLDVAEVGAVN